MTTTKQNQNANNNVVNAKSQPNFEVEKREVKHIPTVQIKGQYLLISKGNCGGKCSYKQ